MEQRTGRQAERRASRPKDETGSRPLPHPGSSWIRAALIQIAALHLRAIERALAKSGVEFTANGARLRKTRALPGLSRRPVVAAGNHNTDVATDLVTPLSQLMAAAKQEDGGDVAAVVMSAVEPSRRGALAALVAGRPAMFSEPVVVACLLSAGKVGLANAMWALPAMGVWRRYVRPQ